MVLKYIVPTYACGRAISISACWCNEYIFCLISLTLMNIVSSSVRVCVRACVFTWVGENICVPECRYQCVHKLQTICMSKVELVREPGCVFAWERQRDRDRVWEGVKSDPPQCLTFNHCLPTRDPMTSLNKRFCYRLPVVGETRASPTKPLTKNLSFCLIIDYFHKPIWLC